MKRNSDFASMQMLHGGGGWLWSNNHQFGNAYVNVEAPLLRAASTSRVAAYLKLKYVSYLLRRITRQQIGARCRKE